MATNQKILVADDSPMVVAMVSHVLKNAGYSILRAGNGMEAVQTAYREAPDLVVLDIFMPRMNGYLACRILKHDPAMAGIPIIMLSGSESESDAFWSLETGADAFMQKPFDPPQLLEKVQSMLAERGTPQPPEPQQLSAEDVLAKLCGLMDRELYQSTVQQIELKTILQNIREGVMTIDLEGRVGSLNDALCRMLGREPDQLIGKPATDAIGGMAGTETLLLTKQAHSREAVPERDSELKHRDGSVTPVAISVAPLNDYLGKPVGSVCLFQDITRRKQIESLGKLKDDLTHMIVHDLRTPLTALTGGLRTIEMLGELNPDQKEFLDMSVNGGETLLAMINDLLDISKMEDGSMSLDYSDVVPEELIETALRQVESLARDKELTLARKIEPGLGPIRADHQKLLRTLVNLTGNAIKFTPRKGTIRLEVQRSRQENALVFAVADTGEGIPKEAFGKIFEKFGQVENRKAGRKNSTGLGLTFCKMTAEAHGGRIWVESQLGVGSIFSFTIPDNQPMTAVPSTHEAPLAVAK